MHKCKLQQDSTSILLYQLWFRDAVGRVRPLKNQIKTVLKLCETGWNWNKYISIGSIRLHMELMYEISSDRHVISFNSIFLCQDTLRSSNKVILEELDFMNLGK